MAAKKKQRKANEEHHRLCIDFGSKADLLGFISRWNWTALNETEVVRAYKLDSLDLTRIKMGNTYILKRAKDRPDIMELK